MLSKIQREVIDKLYLGLTPQAVAKLTKVDEDVINEWLLNNDDFQNTLDKKGKAAYKDVLRNSARLSGLALRRLEEILEDPNSPSKDVLTAAVTVFKISSSCYGDAQSEEVQEVINELKKIKKQSASK